MDESKFVQLNFETVATCNVCGIYVIIMLSLGHILILDFFVTNLFMHSLSTLLDHTLLQQRCFYVRYHHFCKVNNNGCKQ